MTTSSHCGTACGWRRGTRARRCAPRAPGPGTIRLAYAMAGSMTGAAVDAPGRVDAAPRGAGTARCRRHDAGRRRRSSRGSSSSGRRRSPALRPAEPPAGGDEVGRRVEPLRQAAQGDVGRLDRVLVVRTEVPAQPQHRLGVGRIVEQRIDQLQRRSHGPEATTCRGGCPVPFSTQ